MTAPSDLPSPTIKQFNFLDQVTFSHVLARTWGEGERHWEPRELWSHEPKAGHVIGVRTLKDGSWHKEVDHEYMDGYLISSSYITTFIASRHIRAYLVATTMKHKPVLVLPEHLQAVES